ncbi:MAG: AEC family transporter [Defluviitaleaceae bacterium]|nr:AEC family transporter [Defluviitaleaceae bacterium]MCL2240147.1 AEC family transporter [Defluviitaleaceae bacterium]
MLADLLFSLGIVAPLFLLLFLGYGLKRSGFISEAFSANGNKLMFYIGLPAIIFFSIYRADLREVFDPDFVLAMIGITVTTALAIWLIATLFIKDKAVRGAFVLCSFRGNQAFLGIPLMMNLAGDAGLMRATMVITFVLPFANIISILVMVFNGDKRKKISPWGVGLAILKNPIIIATLAGLGMTFLGVRLPSVPYTSLAYVAQMATPLALLCIGASMRFHGFDKKFGRALTASLVKVLALPLAFAATGYLLGFRGYDLAAMAIMGGVPTAIVSYAQVVEMGGDGYVANTIVVMSTLLSTFTLTLIIYATRVLG